MPRSSPAGYSTVQIALHWIVFLLVAMQFLFHDPIEEVWARRVEGLPLGDFDLAVAQHVLIGLTVGLLMLWRLALRLRRGVPPLPEEEPKLMKLAAHTTHWTFYALLILLPISGVSAWFLGAEQAAEGHEAMTTLLLALVLLHVGAALFHQFWLKSGLMMRMRRPG